MPAAGLLVLAAYLAAAVPPGLAAAWTRVQTAQTEGRDDAWAALARRRGRAYADAIARIREALPEDAVYLLLDTGTDVIVRFDLAPRRAVFGGPPADVAKNVSPDRLASLPRWTVIPSLAPPGPRLVETRVLAEKGAVP